MYEGLEQDQLTGALEALLFVTDEPASALTLAEMLEITPAEAVRGLEQLKARLESQNSGIQLAEVAGGWRLYTHPAYHDLLTKYVLSWDTRKMSQAALEVLAIVAYGQPLTRAQVAGIRGVNSDGVIATLVDRGYLREAGVADTPGNPVLYGTTTAFLERFGLASPADLPNLEDFAPDEKTAQLIRERLSATKALGSFSAEDAQGQAVEADGSAAALSTIDAPSPFDVVEKIDFDSLEFDTDSE